MQTVQLELEKTATNTNVFSGTELDTPLANGVMYLRVASTVNTATIEVPQFGHKTGYTQLIVKNATDGIPKAQDVLPFVIPFVRGNTPIVILGGTTGTCHFSATIIYNC